MNALPTPQQLTSDAKEALRKTIRRLREALITQLTDEVKGAYRWSVPLGKAKLPHAMAMRRQRLENWLEEQSRGDWKKGKKPSEKQLAELHERYLNQAVKEAAHTLLNRLVVLRILEVAGLSSPWCSAAAGRAQATASLQSLVGRSAAT